MEASVMKTVAQRGRVTGGEQSARRRFVIAMRDPRPLPEATIELPAPSPLPGSPPTINLISSILPPVVLLAGMFIYVRLNPTINLGFIILMPMMSLAFPIGNLISYFAQKRAYRKKLELREQSYRSVLAQQREQLNKIAADQRIVLESEYPRTTNVVQLAQGRSSRRPLWWRRSADSDFLSLRMGTGFGQPSFTVSPPRISDPNDALHPLAIEIAKGYKEIPNLPLLVDLQKAGSLAIAGKSEASVQKLARRLVLDILVHHSPQEVQVAVLADSDAAQKRWDWLKWTPHTRAIHQVDSIRRMAFDPTSVDKCLEWVMAEYNQRKDPDRTATRRTTQSAIVIIVDDSGDIRHIGDIKLLADSGREAEIYLIFAGGRNWPRECRARIDVTDDEFDYVETWAGEKSNKRIKGKIDPASLAECEKVARALASLELSGGKGGENLPESVRLYDLVSPSPPSVEIIKHNWSLRLADSELLRFPFGLHSGRKGLEEVELNLLPEDLGGQSAYHTILVGTTGSGKSEFMKSLVLATAYRYSPKHLNFFFMDFKGGAAFNVLRDLPHVVGVVTNLGPELVERGLSAIEAEMERRQKRFAEEGVQNIWAYNARYTENPMPHLLLLLDEFARGMEDFERLPEMLDRLVRLGRSLGMYMFLANQDVNPAVDRLLNNVGWRIALKVARSEEMHIINRALPIVKRAGQGYLVSTNSDPIEFQAAYAGFLMADPQEQVQEAFKVFQVGADGRRTLIHSSQPQVQVQEVKRVRQYEQDHLISLMKTASQEVEPARPIYLDPLGENITLEQVFSGSALQRVFTGAWRENVGVGNRLIAPIGYFDSPRECLQAELEIDFEERDGHLWIVGAPGSGKAMTVESILLSLALTHTPEEVHFYALDYGAGGRLQKFESLPHTGTILPSTHSEEQLNRLLNYLDDEMDLRTARLVRESLETVTTPAIFLIISNYREMRENYPDHADRIKRFVSNGKAVGLHLIVTTSNRYELLGMTIDRKLVLRLGSRDEYMDIVGRSALIPAGRAEGRGLWAVDQRIVECQVAQSKVQVDGRESLQDARALCLHMQNEWRGPTAPRIEVLPTRIHLDQLLEELTSAPDEGVIVPIGRSYETLELVAPHLLGEISRWLVLGPPRTGKSNFLACLATSVLARHQEAWEVIYLSMRRSPMDWVGARPVVVSRTTDETARTLERIHQTLDGQTPNGRKILLLIDDLAAAFEPGREALVPLLDSLALKTSSSDLVYIVATGVKDEMQRQMSSRLVQNLRQCHTGMNFSKDTNDFDWFGAQFPRQYYRLDLPPGRGFWISNGKPILVQTPIL